MTVVILTPQSTSLPRIQDGTQTFNNSQVTCSCDTHNLRLSIASAFAQNSPHHQALEMMNNSANTDKCAKVPSFKIRQSPTQTHPPLLSIATRPFSLCKEKYHRFPQISLLWWWRGGGR